jgi:hypothetical protein
MQERANTHNPTYTLTNNQTATQLATEDVHIMRETKGGEKEQDMYIMHQSETKERGRYSPSGIRGSSIHLMS